MVVSSLAVTERSRAGADLAAVEHGVDLGVERVGGRAPGAGDRGPAAGPAATDPAMPRAKTVTRSVETAPMVRSPGVMTGAPAGTSSVAVTRLVTSLMPAAAPTVTLVRVPPVEIWIATPPASAWTSPPAVAVTVMSPPWATTLGDPVTAASTI